MIPMRDFMPHCIYLAVIVLIGAGALVLGSEALMNLLIGVGQALGDLLLVAIAVMMGLVTRRQRVLVPLMAVLALALAGVHVWENAWLGASMTPALVLPLFLAALGVAYLVNAGRLLLIMRKSLARPQ